MPRGATSTTWVVPFVGGPTDWVEGTYNASCSTPGSSIGGSFEIVDTTSPFGKFGPPPNIDDLLRKFGLGGGQSPPPSPAPPESPSSVRDAKWDALMKDLLGHTHEGAAPSELAPADGSTAPSAPPVAPPASTSVPLPPVVPRIYSTDTEFGPIVFEGDQFDAGSVKYIGYDVAVPGGPGHPFKIKRCGMERCERA